MKHIDLNCDLGESFGAYSTGMDDKVMAYISSANIACGWHAGDPVVMDRTVEMAKANNVGVGAHPGYPDLLGFGRRSMALNPEEIKNYLIYQIGALKAFCTVHNTFLRHVKPHGALYLDAVEHKPVAEAIANAILAADPELKFVALAGQKGEAMRNIGKKLGLNVIHEAFPDRAYTPQGTLLPRKAPGAVITDPDHVAQRAIDMAGGFVKAIDGSTIELDVQTLCMHGDNKGAVSLVKCIKERLDAKNICITPMGQKDR